MISSFTTLLHSNCAANRVVKQLKQVSGLTLGMCISSSISVNGTYNPVTKQITFKTDFASTFPDIFREEVFHAYQDNVGYSGGIGSYGMTTGYANLEFEYQVFKDIMNGLRRQGYR